MNCPMTLEEAYGAAMKALCRREGHRPRMPGCINTGTSIESSEHIKARRLRVLEARKATTSPGAIALALNITKSSVIRDVRALRVAGLI